MPSDKTVTKRRGRKKKSEVEKKNNGATLGFETTLWKAADKLRNNLDAAEYKHVVLGLIFLKYISDAFLEKHAKLKAEVKQGGQFYTPRCVAQTLVKMLAPYKGRVFDPCCGSGGMFVQSEKFVEAHGGHLGDISIYGQESNPTTWRLARLEEIRKNLKGLGYGVQS